MAQINSVNAAGQQIAPLMMQTQEGGPEETTKKELKTLAGQIGVVYSERETPEEILTRIAEELEAQIDEAENNPQELSTLMGYFNKLKGIDAMLDEINSVRNNIYTAMDLVTTNKTHNPQYE